MYKRCSTNCIFNNTNKHCVSLVFQKKSNVISLEFTRHENCQTCKKKIVLDVEFIFNPPWIYVQTNLKNPIFVTELTKTLKFGNKIFQFLRAIIYAKNHFRSIFCLNSKIYLVDDLSKNIVTKISKLKVVSSFYFLITQ